MTAQALAVRDPARASAARPAGEDAASRRQDRAAPEAVWRRTAMSAVEAEAAGLLTVCKTPKELPDAVRAAAKQDSPKAVEAFHASHRGASQRIYEAIQPLLLERG